jgi:hypothetical protein
VVVGHDNGTGVSLKGNLAYGLVVELYGLVSALSDEEAPGYLVPGVEHEGPSGFPGHVGRVEAVGVKIPGCIVAPGHLRGRVLAEDLAHNAIVVNHINAFIG